MKIRDMKREIKFRAWDGNQMYIGYSSNDGLHYLSSWIEAHSAISKEKDSILMQFTGVKDKKGNEIYDGDIIKYSIIKRKKIIDVVTDVHWGKYCAWVMRDNKTYMVEDRALSIISKRCEVIGNIYENPELLKL